MLLLPETKTSYLDLGELAAFTGAFAAGDNPDALLYVRAGSRTVEAHIRRFIYQLEAESFYLDADRDGQHWYSLPFDLVTLTGLDADDDEDLTFGTDIYNDSDYTVVKIPYRAPHHALSIRPWPPVTAGEQRIKATGTWGWPQTSKDSGDTVQDDPLSAGATTVTVTASSNFEIGQTLLVESEQMTVEAAPTSTTLTVERAANGTTATSHVQSTAISILTWNYAISQATGIIASRLWKRRDSAYAQNVVENPLIEAPGLIDRDLMTILAPYRRYATP